MALPMTVLYVLQFNRIMDIVFSFNHQMTLNETFSGKINNIRKRVTFGYL